MSDLPPERLAAFLPPFYFTGVDYFGPLTIKLNKRVNLNHQSPVMSDLPPERLAAFLPPFYFTGVDYFGPLTIKLNKRTRSTSGTAKRYNALFTCVTTRAAT